ncbi:MAG: sugar phosphate nucleotidyltransferase [Oscillospiraceae bacterium]|nr:sugar phosphate nucleotidyltransferase [Oscillospiraceae bacterium]
MNKSELVVMAAGMGSRFGGLKQITPVGPNGEIIVDYSINDAVKAGFSKSIFIIKKEIEKDFREAVGKRIEKIMDVDYAFQEIDKVPGNFQIPQDRTKPWGTAHAILCAKDVVCAPFAVINADDFYGQSSFKIINDFITNQNEMCMVGYRLGNTLTDNGSVSRGVCDVENGYLKSVTEHTSLDKNTSISLDTTVSMNMWGFNLSIFDEIEAEFTPFLKSMANPLKSEFFLPSVVDKMIKEKGANVRVLNTEEKWYGVTYKQDVEPVQAAILSFIKQGIYKG